jgi:sulfatase modifying factor 1
MADPRLPQPFPPPWASDWGQDEFGLWIVFTYKGIRHCFRWIGPDRFMMDSPSTEAEPDDNETRHEVILTKGYWLAETTCTQALWQAVMGTNPSGFKGQERPVERVGWEDVQAFLHSLNSEQPGLGLHLPSEAEWECACRARAVRGWPMAAVGPYPFTLVVRRFHHRRYRGRLDRYGCT